MFDLYIWSNIKQRCSSKEQWYYNYNYMCVSFHTVMSTHYISHWIIYDHCVREWVSLSLLLGLRPKVSIWGRLWPPALIRIVLPSTKVGFTAGQGISWAKPSQQQHCVKVLKKRGLFAPFFDLTPFTIYFLMEMGWRPLQNAYLLYLVVFCRGLINLLPIILVYCRNN